MEKILFELAKIQNNAKKKIKKINKHCKLRFKADEIWDKDTGAIYLLDEDSVIQKKKYIEHPLFKLFDINCVESKRRYTCNFNDRVILRGAENYYYAFCYVGDLEIKLNEIIDTISKLKKFIINSEEYIGLKEYSYDNVLDLKFILALLDILRNSIVTELFFYLMKENKINDIYVYSVDNNTLANKLYKLLKNVEDKLVDIILFQQYNLVEKINIILGDFIILQNEIIEDILTNGEEYQNDLYIRYRKSREADNILENIICIKDSVDLILSEDIRKLDNCYILGINYGSVELACITEVILTKMNVVVKAGNIMKKFRKVYIETTNNQKYIENVKIEKSLKYLLIDENIMTGNTIKSAKKYLEKFNLKEIDTIIIQYPTVARVKNLYKNVNEKEYINILRKVKGMISPVKYSKFCEYRDGFIFPYMDKLGNFDLYKSKILKNLYKNGSYNENSAVARIAEYYKERFI